MITAIALILCLLGVAADCVTTIVGFRRGFVEVNPLMPHRPAGVIAMNATIGIAVFLGFVAFRGTVNDVGLTLALGALAAVKIGAAALNVRRLRRQP